MCKKNKCKQQVIVRRHDGGETVAAAAAAAAATVMKLLISRNMTWGVFQDRVMRRLHTVHAAVTMVLGK